MRFIKNIFKKKPIASSLGTQLPKRSKTKRVATYIRKKIPRNWEDIDPRKINLETVSKNSNRFRWGLILLSVFFASILASQIISLFVRPTYTPIPAKKTAFVKPPPPTEEYNIIEERNIFDVENKIPENFDPGFLDCFSQARKSSAQIKLHGTIVMKDESLSVALIQDEGNPQKIAVRKNESFFDKYTVMKIDRKKICFQDKATQELEMIEIPEEGGAIGSTGLSFSGKGSEGITPKSETEYVIKSAFLESQLNDLNSLLQTAKANPYMEGGKMKGFLIQSIDPDSIFGSLGIRQGDVLTNVSGIPLDNIGKGVEAFQRLRKATKVELKVLRGGQEVPLTYEVK